MRETFHGHALCMWKERASDTIIPKNVTILKIRLAPSELKLGRRIAILIKMPFQVATIGKTRTLYEFLVDLFLAPWLGRHPARWNLKFAVELRYRNHLLGGAASAAETQGRGRGGSQKASQGGWCSNWILKAESQLGWWGTEAPSRNKYRCWGRRIWCFLETIRCSMRLGHGWCGEKE